MKRVIYAGILAILMASCQSAAPKAGFGDNSNDCAQFFQIIAHDTTIEGQRYSYREAIIFNPWEKEQTVLSRYYLTNDSCTPVPDEQLRLRIPLKHVTTGSCTHVGFIHELGVMNCVSGVTDRALIYAPLPEDIIDLGDGMKPNIEQMLRLRPDAVFVSSYSAADATREQLRKMGLTTIPVVEWMENSPLARAEWIRFFGILLGQEMAADSIYQAVASHYCSLVETVRHSDQYQTKSILSGNNFRGTWYVPSGINYMGQLFADAGAVYAYANDSTPGSLPLSIEQVLQTFRDADVWVGAPASTLEELKDLDEKHSWFSSFTNGQVYNFNARTTATGGNDFWENGTIRPDLILEDLIHILYPTIEPDYQFVYTDQLK